MAVTGTQYVVYQKPTMRHHCLAWLWSTTRHMSAPGMTERCMPQNWHRSTRTTSSPRRITSLIVKCSLLLCMMCTHSPSVSIAIQKDSLSSYLDFSAFIDFYSISEPSVCSTPSRGGCSHLCLMSSRGSHHCACATRGALFLDSDQRTCISKCK